jgi:hypothetical protein
VIACQLLFLQVRGARSQRHPKGSAKYGPARMSIPTSAEAVRVAGWGGMLADEQLNRKLVVLGDGACGKVRVGLASLRLARAHGVDIIIDRLYQGCVYRGGCCCRARPC